MFLLKKAAGHILTPLPAAMILLLVAVALLAAGRRPRLARALAALALAVLAAFSNEAISVAVIAPLEARFPAAPSHIGPGGGPVSGCAFVVVLGGGHSDMESLPPMARLSTSALGRIAEGVRIARALPSARLLVSGPGEAGRPSHAQVLAESAESLGIEPGRITLITEARDTEDEARAVAAIAGDRPVALVTSAWHMPRAMRLFRRAGVNAVACPADFMAKPDGSPAAFIVWNSECLDRSSFAIHEWLGLLWLRLRGA